MAKVGMQRGLKNYIQELRNCSTKEAEKERVDKELGKIRKKYTSDKTLSAYDKRKYMWKLLYTKMLGYDVDFGQKQAMDLMATTGYAEKQVGYVACGIFLNEKDELLRLVINSVRNDLISRNETFQCLALEFTANVGGSEFAQLLTSDVMNVLTNGATRPIVRKKAALCLLRLIRKAPADSDIMPAQEWAGKIAALLEERDTGVVLGITTLLLGVVSRNYEGFEVCVPRLIHILDRLKARDVPQDYTYYGLASPWLQVRALRVLQYFPPPEDPALLRALSDTIQRILAGNEQAKNPNKNNAVHAIVFEAIAVAVGLCDPELLTTGIGVLARFLTVREANLKYLALENLGRLARAPEVAEAIGRHQKTIMACLHDPDISIRRRALDLMFTTASATSAAAVVDELLSALPRADYALREELVLKAAVLAERFPPSSEWYVDAMLRLMEIAGDATMDDVWHSVVQLVASEPSLQTYAATKVIQALQRGAASEVFVRCAAFVLAEHGRHVAAAAAAVEEKEEGENEQENEGGLSLVDQFALLHQRFPASTPETKAMLLTAYEKMRASSPRDQKLAASVADVMEKFKSAPDAELQQRAVEYSGLAERPSAAAVAIQVLPPWEKRTSLLLRRLAEREGEGEEETRERPAWMTMEEGGDSIEVTSPEDKKNEEEEQAVDKKKEEEEKEEAETVPPPVPVVVPDLLDLLDLSEPPPPEQQQQPSAPTTIQTETSPELDALAGLHPHTYTSPSPSMTSNPFADPVIPARIQPIGSIPAWLMALYQSPSGILYEDVNLQIGIRMTLQGSIAQLGFYLGNKSQHILEHLIFTVPPNPAFALSLGAPPALLEPGRQLLIPLEAVCLSSFTALPVLQVGYTVRDENAQLAVTLTLPLPGTKFCQPVDIPVSVFLTRWAQVAGAPFKLSHPVNTHATASDVARLLGALQLQVLDGVDDSPHAVCAACVFHCGVPQQARQIPCMVKVEGLYGGDVGMVTVATADAMCSEALKGVLVQQIENLGASVGG